MQERSALPDTIGGINVSVLTLQEAGFAFAMVEAAIRLPARCDLPAQESTLINIWNQAIAYAADIPLRQIPDRSFILPSSGDDQVFPQREVKTEE